MSEDAIRRQIEVAQVLAADPEARVACPRCGEGLVRLRDSAPMPDGAFERVLTCSICDFRSFLRMQAAGSLA